MLSVKNRKKEEQRQLALLLIAVQASVVNRTLAVRFQGAEKTVVCAVQGEKRWLLCPLPF